MLKEIDGEQYVSLTDLLENTIKPAVMVPWNGVYVPVILKELNYVEIRSCGDFSLIETLQDVVNKKGNKKLSNRDIIAYSELQYSLVKKALVSPTYEEIFKLNEFDLIAKNAQDELKILEDEIDSLEDGPKKDRLQSELEMLQIQYRFLLPEDFIAYIMSYALQLDKTDIKLVTEDMLYEAAIMAKKGNNNPSDHLDGKFTTFNKEDINKRAWILFSQKTKQNSPIKKR